MGGWVGEYGMRWGGKMGNAMGKEGGVAETFNPEDANIEILKVAKSEMLRSRPVRPFENEWKVTRE